MTDLYHLSTEPALIDLGKRGVSLVIADVPFVCGAVQHAAGVQHYLEGRPHQRIRVRALNPDRVGTMKVWQRWW